MDISVCYLKVWNLVINFWSDFAVWFDCSLIQCLRRWFRWIQVECWSTGLVLARTISFHVLLVGSTRPIPISMSSPRYSLVTDIIARDNMWWFRL